MEKKKNIVFSNIEKMNKTRTYYEGEYDPADYFEEIEVEKSDYFMFSGKDYELPYPFYSMFRRLIDFAEEFEMYLDSEHNEPIPEYIQYMYDDFINCVPNGWKNDKLYHHFPNSVEQLKTFEDINKFALLVQAMDDPFGHNLLDDSDKVLYWLNYFDDDSWECESISNNLCDNLFMKKNIKAEKKHQLISVAKGNVFDCFYEEFDITSNFEFETLEAVECSVHCLVIPQYHEDFIYWNEIKAQFNKEMESINDFYLWDADSGKLTKLTDDYCIISLLNPSDYYY